MTIEALKAYLTEHRVPEHLCVSPYRDRQPCPNEAAAVEAFLQQLRELLLSAHGQVLP